jgi:hypothetical protein
MADLSKDETPRRDVCCCEDSAGPQSTRATGKRERAVLKPMGLRRRNDDFHMSYLNVPHEMEPWNHDLILSE